MNSSSNPSATWLLFCRERVLKHRLHWTCICGARKVEAEFVLTHPGHLYNLAAEGILLGAKFSLEAWSRRRLEADVRDSHVPLFVGNFQHEGGASGDFTIRPRKDGELMTLGLYGAPHSVRVVKVESTLVACPLVVHGIRNVNIRFENFHDVWHKPYILKDEIPARPGWRHYAGRCISSPTNPDGTPPMVPVLATMTIAYNQLLTHHYMTAA